MATTNNRSYDLAEIIASTQDDTNENTEVQNRFIGAVEDPKVSDTASAANWGPPYVCTTASVPTAGQIVCEFWSCS